MSKGKLERSLYPSVVCHFTRRSNVLISILESMFFKVSYAKEEIIGTDASRTFGIPMVSFCDIRLSQLNEHITKYGKYGIALNKKWAISKGLNPVSYISKDCSMFDRLDNRLRELRDFMKHLKSEGSLEEYKIALEQYNDFINTMRYMKNYEGDLVRTKKPLIENYRFANEHEWRYIPDIDSDIIPIRKVIPNTNWKTEANNSISKEAVSQLNFSLDDVKYIFIKDEIMSHKIVKKLQSIFDEKKFALIMPKLLITTQVFDDF
ncbi:hypothetical protein Q6W56_004526 [Salmonella enterica]|uniref:abortive infection system antitoxin AbiGi family protein n=1 Tax=Citrobacter braakii TaxID=57706 RepID=UPI001907634A|nr:abortive infection system antitoxin AbiGi family protein [Citrobacter braakii]EGX8054714.1 hypothetical protein [Salmonella enterica subsp. enterica serovar Inganda]ELC6705760.1 hypothetical protein [Salmonella enterica]MBJ8847854.1 hypothetical protein [Citrobacter braakii]